MTVSRSTFLGLALGSLASVLWGSVNVCARYLVDSRGLDPMFVASVRFCSGALVALGFMILTGRGSELRAATRELPLLLLLGAIGIFAMGSMVFLSARYTASVNSAVILNANPLFIALLAPLAGERVPWLRRLGVLLGLGGCVLVSLGHATQEAASTNDLLGCGFAALGAFFWASYTVMGKGVTQRCGGLASATWSLVGGAVLFLLVVSIAGGVRPLTPSEAAVGLYLGIGPTAVAMLAWYRALEYVDASLLGPTEYLAILVGALLGWLLLGENLTAMLILGAVIIVVGLFLATHEPDRAGE